MSYEVDDQQQSRRVLRVPFIRRPIRAGDAVARVTRAFGIKPCLPCKRRQARMNRWLQLVPRR
jgi:hypothetical protein